MSDESVDQSWRDTLTWIVQWGTPAIMVVPYTPEDLTTPEAWETCSASDCFSRAHFSVGMRTTEGMLGGVVCRDHLVVIVSDMKLADNGREFPG